MAIANPNPRVQATRLQMKTLRKALRDAKDRLARLRKSYRRQRKALRNQQTTTAGGRLAKLRLESRISQLSLKEKQAVLDFNRKKASVTARLEILRKQISNVR